MRDALTVRAKLVDEAPGFLAFDVFTDQADPSSFYSFSLWRDADAFEAWATAHGMKTSDAVSPEGLELDPAATWRVTLERVPGPNEAGLGRVRDELFAANNELVVLVRELARTKAELASTLGKLRESHWHLEKIHSVLPICMDCGHVRTAAQGKEWETLARYLRRADLKLSHGCCPACAEKAGV